jgi:hypothetical protein
VLEEVALAEPPAEAYAGSEDDAESVALDDEVGMVAGKANEAPPVVDGDWVDVDVLEEVALAEPPAEAYAGSKDDAESVAPDDEVGMVIEKEDEAPLVVNDDGEDVDVLEDVALAEPLAEENVESDDVAESVALDDEGGTDTGEEDEVNVELAADKVGKPAPAGVGGAAPPG